MSIFVPERLRFNEAEGDVTGEEQPKLMCASTGMPAFEQGWKRRRYARVDLMLHKTCTKRSDGTDIPECEMKSLQVRM